MPYYNGYWDNSTCCTNDYNYDNDSSNNFKIVCKDVKKQCRLMENINADGTHSQYNVSNFYKIL